MNYLLTVIEQLLNILGIEYSSNVTISKDFILLKVSSISYRHEL